MQGFAVRDPVQEESQRFLLYQNCVTNVQPVPPLQVLKLLLHMYMNMKQKPVWNDLDPKVLTADELFGFIHHATREWKDGK